MGVTPKMNFLIIFSLCIGVIQAETIKAGCAWNGEYDPAEVTKGWGNVPVASGHTWKLTSVFKTGKSFLRLPVSGVTRVTDFDGDGVQDLLVATDGRVYFYRQKSGHLETPVPVTANGVPIDTWIRGNKRTGFAYTDINGDNKPDIILTADKDLVYYPGKTGKDFGAKVSLGRIDNNQFDVGDWNRDGLPDVITGQFNGYFNYYPNIGSKTAPRLGSKKQAFNLGQMAYWRYPRIMDLNNDGKMDLLYSINWGYFGMCFQGEKVYFHESRLKLEAGEAINVREKYSENQAPEVADFNGDGIVDLITSGQKGDVVIFFGVDVIQSAQKEIRDMLRSHPSDLSYQIKSNDIFYNRIYDKNRQLQEFVNNKFASTQAERESVYKFYEQLVKDYPQYLTRQKWSDATLAYFAGYVWIIMLETRPNTPTNRAQLATLTKQTDYDYGLFRDYGIFLVNNNRAPSNKAKLIYDFMKMKNPILYSLSRITQNGFLKDGKSWKYDNMRESGVNIFTGGNYGEYSFPNDCQVCKQAGRNPRIMQFLVALAHEVAHNELDQNKAEAYRFDLYVRKFQILARATGNKVVWKSPVNHGYDQQKTQDLWKKNGWWDGSSKWGDALKNFFNYGQGKDLMLNSIRGSLDYFIQAPQEAFATLANQYFADSKLMLDFAVERTRKGHPTNIDWFLLVAEYYSLGGNKIPMFVITSSGVMSKYTATLRRNNAGHITGLTVPSSSQQPGPYDYTFTVDGRGLVTSVSTR